MSVRPATTDDVPAIQRVAADAWHAAHDDIVGESTVDEFLASHYGEDDVRAGVVDPDALYYVAEDGTDGVVGFLTGGPWRDEKTTYVVGALYVRPTHWGQGFGSGLLRQFENEAGAQGARQVRLVVMAENDRAIDFYESVGYERVDDHYDDDLEVRGYVYARALG